MTLIASHLLQFKVIGSYIIKQQICNTSQSLLYHACPEVLGWFVSYNSGTKDADFVTCIRDSDCSIRVY